MVLLHPKQALIAEDTHRFRVINCGRRFGKTVLAVEEIKGMALFKESKIVYIAPTIQQARDIAWQQIKEELRPITKQAKEAPSLEIEVYNKLGTTSHIALRGWEAIETLRGQSFDFMVIDEVASMRNFFLNWQEVLRPTLTDRKGQAMFISTPKGFNHFYDLYNLETKDSDYKSFHFSSYDNPFIPSEEIDKAKIELTEDRFSQEYMADFRKTDGLVYKEFIREKHLYEKLPDKTLEKIGGVDFGYTNPAAVLDIRTNGEEYWIEREWYQRERTDAQIAEVVKAMNFDSVYPDPESPAAIKELRERGINCREVLKGKDSIKTGIQRIRELFLANKLHINRECINLIYELETYSYEDQKESNQNEKPIKANDHLLDALRYVILMKRPEPTIRFKQSEYQSFTPYGI